MIPMLDTEPGSAEEHYTKQHCKARNAVERCIGVLKARFRCLLKDRALHYDPKRAAEIVKACCVLHNMCILVRIIQINPLFSDKVHTKSPNVNE